MTHTQLSNSDGRKNTVKDTLTTPKPRATVENKAFAAFVERIMRAYSRRVAGGDVEAFTDLLAMEQNLSQVVADAVTGLRKYGYTWADIGRVAGITKQAAHERWGGERR